MKFNFGKDGNIDVVLVFEENKLQNDLLNFLMEKEIFKASLGQTYLDLNSSGKGTLFLGLGKEEDLKIDNLRLAFFKLGKALAENKVESINLKVESLNNLDYFYTINAITEGLLQSTSVFDKYLSNKKFNPTIENVYFEVEDEKVAQDAITEAEIVFEGIEITRELVNERAINMYPEVLANKAVEYLEPVGVEVEVFGLEEIKKMNMEAFLAVAHGSDKEPKFIVMTYNGDPSSDEKIALVGKGLTYDSGGYSLKPSTSMDTMYTDMAGSGTVIGALRAIAKGKVKRNVVGVVAACENLVDGKAYKPGDIIGSMAGKTIEVLNTDAEGRLTLADALWYTVKEIKADKIIDLATLTGACIMAFADITTGAITNNDELMNDVIEASKLAGEPIWQLPSYDEYKDMFKSDYADMANTNTKGRGAGTITAGLFLENFVEDTPWVHLDIAGTSYLSSGKKYLPQGASGVHVKTLFNLVK